MKAKRIRICGRKTMTPPTPAMAPSTSRLASAPSGSGARTHSPVADVAPSMSSINGVAQENTAWKTAAITSTNRMEPMTG